MVEAVAAPRLERFAKPLFVATIITGSFLLFLTQPMIARMALPRLGGAPAVWNSAMLVYQALLLGGYAWAHWLTRLRPQRQAGLHLAAFAIAALWLPIGLAQAVPPASFSPALWVPWFLISSMGPLFFVIAAQAPLMQRWYALESERGEPYALYAASNLGSFAGLIAYPLLVEPLLSLHAQSWLWTGGYAVLTLLLAACAFTVRSVPPEEHQAPASPVPDRRRVLHWLALAAIPSGLMLSTTTHLTTDIVAMPLLWVVPLGLYLLSFVIAFANKRRAADFITQFAPLIILIGGGFAFMEGSRNQMMVAGIGLILLFTIAVALHTQMYRLRPASDRLTIFYLTMSVGGMLGGLFCALVAPAIFDWAYEHPLLILAAAALVPQSPFWGGLDRLKRPIVAGFVLLAFLLSFATDRGLAGEPLSDIGKVLATTFIAVSAALAVGRRWIFALLLAALMLSHGGWSVLNISRFDTRTRSYFGVYSVGDRDGARILTHGTTMHGTQDLRPGRERSPTTYYAPGSGVGQTMLLAGALYGPQARIGVVGLGTGTLSCYKQPGQSWTFFEIDPKMARLARDSGYFTFLANCAPDARIVLGDARIRLGEEKPASLDILAIDAFSSDAVPMHLLTREAVRIYGRALQQKGVLLFHISNRYIDLEPVIAAAARNEGWHSAVLFYSPTDEEEKNFATVSNWVALSRDGEVLDRLIAANKGASGWQDVIERPGFPGWTDDYATILPLLKLWD
jgi:SAM-dependent methyltransferase